MFIFKFDILNLFLTFSGKSIVGIVSKETGAASVGNWNTINWDNQTN